MTTKSDHARQAQLRGLALFPIDENIKDPPYGMMWTSQSTKDIKQILEWYRLNKNYNIGCDVGKSDMVVIDIDQKHGKKGWDWYNLMELLYGWPPTYTVSTPSGGLHIFFRTTKRYKNTNGKIHNGVDVKSAGGYVLVAGSSLAEYGGAEYKVVTHFDEAAVPDWLDKILDEASAASPEKTNNQIVLSSDEDADIERARQWLLKDAKHAIQGDAGDHTTYATACRLKEFGVSQDKALDLMLDNYNDQCSPPWSIDELAVKVKNAYRYSQQPQGADALPAEFTPDKLSGTESGLKPDMSLMQQNRKPAPEFPLHILPEKWQEWVKLSAGAKSCGVDFVAHGLLITTAGMIGNARRASPWQGWEEPTILWGALVGLPSTGKSPAVDTVLEAIRILEAEGAEQYKEALRKYEEQCAAAKCHEENWQTAVKEAVKKKNTSPAKPVEAIAPEQPPRPRLVITDATSEKAAYLLSKTPKGLLLYRDELSGLLENLERRGGSDRSFYLESYGGRSYTVDRVKHPEPIIIPSLAISIIGGIQPDRLNTLLMKGDDDGLAARFLYTWPESVTFQRPASFPDNSMLQQVFRRLNTLQPGKNDKGKPIPTIIPFEEKAAAIIAEWYKKQPEKEEGASGVLLSHIGKMPGTAVRLASVLYHLEWASDEYSPEPGKISERHIVSAIALLDDYYLPMAQRCFGDASLPQDQRDAIMVARWIMKEKPEIINAYALSRTAGSPLRDKKRLAEALRALEEAHWISPAPARDSQHRGRQRQDYQVNPALWEAKV